MKKRIAVCLLAFALLLSFGACGQKSEGPSSGGVLSKEELSQYEALYGESFDTVKQELKISEDDVSSGDGLQGMPKIENMMGPAYGQEPVFRLLLTVPGEELMGLQYNFVFQSEEEQAKAGEVLKNLFEDAKKAYGEPSTYEGLTNRIADHLEEIEKTGITAEYSETWAPSSKTTFTLTASQMQDAAQGSAVVITLRYAVPSQLPQ